MSSKEVRGTLLLVIEEKQPKEPMSSPLQTSSVLDATAKRLGANYGGIALEQALLTQLHDLFRTGYLAWGFNLANPDPPFFHITAQGRSLLATLSRDPGNPDGYMRHLAEKAVLGDIARSYLEEGLECYVAGLYKASAVMVGGAAEGLILELRDVLVARLGALGKAIPAQLTTWQIKTVLDSLFALLAAEKKNFLKPLRDEFESYWPAFAQQIRAARNEAGHPTSVAPVTSETVHGSLLILPELARLQNQLVDWINTGFK